MLQSSFKDSSTTAINGIEKCIFNFNYLSPSKRKTKVVLFGTVTVKQSVCRENNDHKLTTINAAYKYIYY